jgi:hypothetical protein
MEASATEFEDRELAAALERSKTDGPTTNSGQTIAATNDAQSAAAINVAQPAASSSAQPNPDAKVTVLPSDTFTEENVLSLIKYGFPREKVRTFFI